MFSTTASSTGPRSVGEPAITPRTSPVAVCCASASVSRRCCASTCCLRPALSWRAAASSASRRATGAASVRRRRPPVAPPRLPPVAHHAPTSTLPPRRRPTGRRTQDPRRGGSRRTCPPSPARLLAPGARCPPPAGPGSIPPSETRRAGPGPRHRRLPPPTPATTPLPPAQENARNVRHRGARAGPLPVGWTEEAAVAQPLPCDREGGGGHGAAVGGLGGWGRAGARRERGAGSRGAVVARAFAGPAGQPPAAQAGSVPGRAASRWPDRGPAGPAGPRDSGT